MEKGIIPVALRSVLKKIDPDTATCIKALFDELAKVSAPKPFLTMAEATVYLGCQRNTLNSLLKSGQIAYSRPNDSGSGRVYIKRDDLDAWMMRNYHPAQADIEAKAADYIAAR